MTRGAAVIDVRDLVVRRGRVLALDGVGFATRPGAVTGLLGPSGCGKSTLMRAVVGVQVVTSGTVEVLGLPAGDRRLRDRVGYVTQASSVYDDLTVTREPPVLRPRPRRPRRRGGPLHRRGRPAPAPGTRWSAGSPAASGPGSRWPSRCSARPSCWSSTSRPSGSTRCCGATCGRCSTRSRDAGTAVLVSSHVMDEAERCDRLLLMRDGEAARRRHPGRAPRPHRYDGRGGGVPRPGRGAGAA